MHANFLRVLSGLLVICMLCACMVPAVFAEAEQEPVITHVPTYENTPSNSTHCVLTREPVKITRFTGCSACDANARFQRSADIIGCYFEQQLKIPKAFGNQFSVIRFGDFLNHSGGYGIRPYRSKQHFFIASAHRYEIRTIGTVIKIFQFWGFAFR